LLDIKNESIVNIITDNNKQFVMFLTKHGMIKKSLLTEYQNIKRNGTIGITLKDDDEVVDICYLGNESIILGTKNGLTIHFVTTDITAVGRTAMGVLGIKLKDGDAAAAITPVSTSAPYILTISKNGFAKKTKKEEYTIQKRNGVGVQGIKIADGDSLFAMLSVTDADEILIYSNNILVKTTGKDVPIVGRVSQGNHLAKYGNVNNIHII
jgi:DNA gyrase subunit A